MSKIGNLCEDDFKIVSHKRRKQRQILKNKNLQHVHVDSEVEFDKDTAIRRILGAKEEILHSDFHSSISASLNEAFQILGAPEVSEIVCFGLGKFGECMIARHQFALLLCLKDRLSVPTSAYDPAFTSAERLVLEHFDVACLDANTEGKRPVEAPTLFYLPHCPKQLTNNVLWSNWGLGLSRCIVVSNSFHNIVEAETQRVLAKDAGYLLRISPHVSEVAVINSFKYYEIFNDTAVHVFPVERLALIAEDFWRDCSEPTYDEPEIVLSER